MAYGTVKVDNVTFTYNSVDATTTFSGIYAAITNNLTLSGTVTAATFTGTTANFTNVNAQNIGVTTLLSGLAITGNTAGFTTVTGTTVTGTTANFVTVSGTTVTGTTAQFVSGVFTSLSGATHTITSGVFATGTAALPSISFTSDPNTGIYSPGADQVAISTNGSNRLQIDSSGNVGIGATPVVTFAGQTHLTVNHSAGGTSVAGYNLAVNGTRYASFISYPSNSEALRITAESATLPITFHTNSSERMRLDSSGRLGLGTSSPQATCHVNGAILASSSLAALSASNIFFDQPTSALSRIGVVGANTSTAGTLRISQYSSDGSVGRDVVNINSSGNVGIGTAAPLASIEITGSGECMRIQSTTAGSNYITHKHNSSGDIAYIGAAGGGALSSGANTDYAIRANQGALLFGTNGNNERARIDSSGRLLVGTSSARSIGTQSSVIQNEGTSFATTGASFCANRNDIYGSYITFGKTRGTSIGSNTIVSSGDDLGGLIFSGGDGTDVNSQAAYILCQVDGTPGVDDMPGRLVFSTTADGLSTPTERARITQKGAFKATNTGSYINTAANYHEFINGVNDTVSVYIKSTATNGQQYGLLVETANDQNDGTRYFVQCIGGVTERATIRSNGGIANYSANNVNLSDRNVKKDIAPAAGTWDCLKEWEIVNFRYKDQPDDADISMGVIAQQVAESCPEMITVFQEAKEATETEPAQEKRIGVKEQQMMWMAIKAFQEAQLRIETLEAANAELTARVSALEPG